MADHRPTYEISAPSIAPYVQPLWPGALATMFESRDEQGRRLGLADDHLSGCTMLLVFLGDPESARTIPLLRSLAGLEAQFETANAALIAISASSDAAHNRQLKREAGFPWPIICDAPGGIFASYGLHKGSDLVSRLVLLTPYRQVRAWFDLAGHPDSDADETLGTIMDIIASTKAAEELRWSPPHAPVLIVPNVLSAEECAQLVESVETDTPFMVRRPQPGEIAGNYRIPVYEYDRQDRVDLIIKDQNTVAFLDERIFARVTPMIKKKRSPSM